MKLLPKLSFPKKLPPHNIRLDFAVMLTSIWFITGVYIDGWAHHHLDSIETFFTIWHAVLYSGFFVTALTVGIAWLENVRQGYNLKRALPAGYEWALAGIFIFLGAGVGDMIWHILFGVEVDVEALLSPTHLMLAVGGSLLIACPFRSLWRNKNRKPDLKQWIPGLVSGTLLYMVIVFMLQFTSPINHPWASESVYVNPAAVEDATFFRQSVGISNLLLNVVIVMFFVLALVRRFEIRFGSFTFLFGVSAIAMSFMEDHFYIVPAFIGAGVIADVLYWWLKPSLPKKLQLQLFSFLVPFCLLGLYFLALLIHTDLYWSVHLWTGTMVMAGIGGVLMSGLFVSAKKNIL